ncbi:MAG: flagellar basal-body MS-ring/collar protein FliF, partial [Candidatus Eremiobacterota bacterium]
MRTGSRLATGRGPAAGPGGGPLGKLGEIWGKLSPKVKILLFVVIGLALTGGLTYTVISTTNRPVPLYSTKLSETDVKEVAMKLTDLGVAHHIAITGDEILVHPRDKAQAQIRLSQYGLPRHPIVASLPEGGMGTKTESEMRMIQQNVLEGQLTETIRQVEGVADAYVKLALPEQTYFKSDEKITTATVMLKLQPTVSLNREQVGGIMHLVAFSVPNLKPENVKLVDTSGRDLTAQVPLGEDGMMGAMTAGEMRTKDESDRQRKVQEALDAVLGVGAAKASVVVEYDYSQTDTTRESFGAPVETGSQEATESYDRGGNN